MGNSLVSWALEEFLTRQCVFLFTFPRSNLIYRFLELQEYKMQQYWKKKKMLYMQTKLLATYTSHVI